MPRGREGPKYAGDFEDRRHRHAVVRGPRSSWDRVIVAREQNGRPRFAPAAASQNIRDDRPTDLDVPRRQRVGHLDLRFVSIGPEVGENPLPHDRILLAPGGMRNSVSHQFFEDDAGAAGREFVVGDVGRAGGRRRVDDRADPRQREPRRENNRKSREPFPAVHQFTGRACCAHFGDEFNHLILTTFYSSVPGHDLISQHSAGPAEAAGEFPSFDAVSPHQ